MLEVTSTIMVKCAIFGLVTINVNRRAWFEGSELNWECDGGGSGSGNGGTTIVRYVQNRLS